MLITSPKSLHTRARAHLIYYNKLQIYFWKEIVLFIFSSLYFSNINKCVFINLLTIHRNIRCAYVCVHACACMRSWVCWLVSIVSFATTSFYNSFVTVFNGVYSHKAINKPIFFVLGDMLITIVYSKGWLLCLPSKCRNSLVWSKDDTADC